MRYGTHTPLAHIFGWFVFGILGVVFALYVGYQARFLIAGPTVSLIDPPPAILHERTVIISGVASNITEISINGRPIVTDQAGYFQEPIVLENGYTIVSIAAKDRYGRETTTRLSYMYVPQTLLPTS